MSQLEEFDDYEKDKLSSLIEELECLLVGNQKQLSEACIRKKLDELSAWLADTHEQDDLHEMEQHLYDCLTRIKKVLELTGREYMDLENESPTVAPSDETEPQEFFKIRDRITEIIDTLLQLKSHHDWKEVVHVKPTGR